MSKPRAMFPGNFISSFPFKGLFAPREEGRVLQLLPVLRSWDEKTQMCPTVNTTTPHSP